MHSPPFPTAVPAGPWRVEKDVHGIRVYAASGKILVGSSWVWFSSRAKTLDDIRSAVSIEPRQDVFAARVAIAAQEAVFDAIAALPDLYAAGDALIRLHDTYTGDARDDDAISLAMADLRAALARANGEG